MTGGAWYCIAKTNTFDSGCSIKVAFEDYFIQFSVRVTYGASAINITRCNLPSSAVFSVRLRESDSQWSVDFYSSIDINSTTTIADSDYWTSVNTSAGAGEVILVINDITSKFNTEQSGGGVGESLFEMVNVGTDAVPVYAVVPKNFNGNTVHIFSRGGVSSGGFSGTDNEGNPTGSLGGLSNVDPTADSNFYTDKVLVKRANSATWGVVDLLSIVGLDEDALKRYLTNNLYVTQTDLEPYDERLKTLEALGFKLQKHEVDGVTKYYVESTYDFYSNGGISSGGNSPSSGGSGGGSTVSYIPSITDGELLGTLIIDGVPAALYAPKGITAEDLEGIYATNNDLTSLGNTLSTQIQGKADKTALDEVIERLNEWGLSVQEYEVDGKKKLFLQSSLDFYSNGGISSGGMSPTQGGNTGGSNVSFTPALEYGEPIGIITIDGVDTPVYSPSLADYAKSKDVADTYATKVALNDYATTTALGTATDNITTLQGYFKDGIAKEAAKVSKSLKFGSKTYNGSAEATVTADDLGALTSHQTIYKLSFESGIFAAGDFTANVANKTIKVPTTTSHISEGDNLYYTNARVLKAVADSLGLSTKTENGKTYLRSAYDFFSEGGVSSGGIGTSGGGSGSGSTVSYAQTISDGIPLGTLTIDGVTTKNTIYAPSVLSAYTNDVGYITSSALDGYLPKSGGTISSPTYAAFEIYRSNANDSAIKYSNSSRVLGYIGVAGANGEPFFNPTGDSSTRYTIYHTGNFNPADYLPLSGGNMDDGAKIIFKSSNTYGASSWHLFAFGPTFQIKATTYGSNTADNTPIIQISNSGELYNNGNAVIHSSNIVDYALKIDGSNLMTGYVAWNNGSEGNDVADWNTIRGNGLKIISSDASTSNAPRTYATALHVKGRYGFQLSSIGGDTDELWFKNISRENRDWKHIAFTDSNVASATKLQDNTAFTAWGQTFFENGAPKNVSGDLSLSSSGIYWANDIANYSIKPASNYEIIYKGYRGHSFITAGGECLKILNNGNVLIGTTTDLSDKLQVYEAIGIQPISGGYSGMHFYMNTTTKENWHISVRGGETNKPFRLYYSPDKTTYNALVDITKGGNVLIGTTSANGAKLQVEGNVANLISIRRTTSGGGAYIDYFCSNSQSNQWRVGHYPDNRFTFAKFSGTSEIINAYITSEGNFYASGGIASGSDARYKTRIKDVSVDIETIAKAPLFVYKWADREDDKLHLGTTAQYWYDTDFKNAVVPTNNEKLWTMSYGEIAMGNTIVLAREQLTFKKEIKSEVERLKDRVNELETELNKYRRA